MRKALIVFGLILAVQVLWVGALVAESQLKLRVTLFARASVAEAMRVRKSYMPPSDQVPGTRLTAIEKAVAGMENKAAIFIDLQHNKKKDVIAQFRQMLIEKCCRLAQGGRNGADAVEGGKGRHRSDGGGFGNTGFGKGGR